MKIKNASTKLVLGKSTVANLENVQMNNIRGGDYSDVQTECVTECKTACVTGCVACFETIKPTICH